MAEINALVSIIVPAYNAERTICRAIDSILAQTYEAIEILVVDDGSMDGTEEVCRAFADRIQYIRQDNQGASAARNNGISNASGEFIGFLDADDVYLPNKIERLLELFKRCPDAGAVAGAFVQIIPDGRIITPQPGLVFPDGAKQGYIDYFEREVAGAWVMHTNTVLIRRNALDSVGWFNTGFRFGEDVDLWCRIAGRFPVAFLDEPVAEYDRTNEHSLCSNSSVLGQGVAYLYNRREERQYIAESRLYSYRRFKNRILYARIMLSIYEKKRASLCACLKRVHPLPFNIRYVFALLLLPIPCTFWPSQKIRS